MAANSVVDCLLQADNEAVSHSLLPSNTTLQSIDL